MSGDGGYIPPSPPHSNGSSRANSSTALTDARPLLSLTNLQERRLWTHIDDRLLSLERDERKHAFTTLLRLVSERLLPLLTLILQIPPVEPWGGVRVSYLLTLTGSMIDFITSLPLVKLSSMAHAPTPETSASDIDEVDDAAPAEDEVDAIAQAEAARTMRRLLDLLSEVDRGWLAVLRGDAWIPPAKAGGRGHPIPVQFGCQVGATERIRLRSIIMASRSKFVAWARTYGDFSGVSYPPGSDDAGLTPTALSAESSLDPDMEWEQEVIGLWNGTLQKLSDMDFCVAAGDHAG
ncbi:hypothetical protein BD324DRAFT_651722 [Kockovaella imperatae]|uniref:Uncharacterized protein n=1 Tax=Kockovaella imperatae TaxID=4999 RepID=A0A1Y1UG50_9TREE|nr:hypothetical protein BD324DRAFT_651722 [Kockovaella imperatae]ORX36484.1 hypothetical protein BD324DRAFT_651722 [Kockovaella imperatae]